MYARWLNFPAVMVCATAIWGSAIAACFAIKAAFSLPPFLALACGALICAIAAFVYVRSPAVSDSDRELLEHVFHGKEIRLLRTLGLVRQPGWS
jgi:uncharacterized membrane protein YjfL (UPF0719 family)